MVAPSAGTVPAARIAAATYVLSCASGLVGLFVSRDDPFIVFHAWQSILLGFMTIAAWFALKTIPIFGLAMGLGAVAAWGFASLFLAWRAWGGHWTRLPLLGDIALERISASDGPVN